MPMRAKVIPVSDVTDSTQPELETTGGDLADDGDVDSTPTTGNTYSRSHILVKESDNCANDQIRLRLT